MKTKTLLAAAAFVAVGAISSMAQGNVYSLNIVGYYNVPVTGNLTAMANSLRSGPPGEVDRADHVIPFADGNNIQVWTGVSWQMYTMDSLSSTGWSDDNGDVPLGNLPILGPGKGFFYGNSAGISSVTFVGEVRTGTNTVAISTGLNALGSPLPIGGPIAALGLDAQDGDNIQKWTGTGWSLTSRDSLSSTGWADDNGDAPEPTISVGEGFFYGNSVGAFNWQQVLNP